MRTPVACSASMIAQGPEGVVFLQREVAAPAGGWFAAISSGCGGCVGGEGAGQCFPWRVERLARGRAAAAASTVAESWRRWVAVRIRAGSVTAAGAGEGHHAGCARAPSGCGGHPDRRVRVDDRPGASVQVKTVEAAQHHLAVRLHRRRVTASGRLAAAALAEPTAALDPASSG